ncbi:MAG: sigma 54-interacting transcriptional regulator [Thermodesulfobacteriota bacterium]
MNTKILVIDDEESIRFTFNDFLTEEGHTVFCAGTYDEAVTIIENDDLDLIFVDIILGRYSGIDILKKTKEENLICPVIMITGQPNIDTAADSVRMGAFDYLPKPILQQTLLRVTKIALAHKTIVVEKEKYRNHLDAIFRSVTDAIITINKEMRVIAVNAAAETICRLTPEHAMGKHIDAIANPCLNACSKIIEQTSTQKKIFRDHHIECQYPTGSSRILAINSSPLTDRRDRLLGAILVIRDITRIIRMESELKDLHSFHNIIGKSKKMQRIFNLIKNLAQTQSTVLITGESGTGKEMIARAIHYSGHNASLPMVTVNCSTLVESLLESELFGHVKGAFTGAENNKVGRFQEADGGSIFLDEIGEISPIIQLKLLRVLQEKEFERVGDSKSIKIAVRVIAATNRKLKEAVDNNKFREDLFYRLKVVEIELPPLRERLEDVPLLVDRFCHIFNRRFKKQIKGVTNEVMEAFMRYTWPGNVRELEHALERAFIFCQSKAIALDHIPPEIKSLSSRSRFSQETSGVESERILHMLEKTDWNRAKTARLLGISRKTLYKKINKYNLDPSKGNLVE